jgi:hypothetical protein
VRSFWQSALAIYATLRGMTKWTYASLGALLAMLGACSGSNARSPHTQEGAPAAPPADGTARRATSAHDSSPWIAPLPASGAATPGTFVVRNGTDAAVRIDTTDGSAWAIVVGPSEPSLGPVSVHGDTYCDCLCADATDSRRASGCRECEPPVPSFETIAPGATWELPWSGELKRPSANATQQCGRVFAAPPGEYEFAACSEQGVCGLTRVTWPRAEPIVITLGQGYPEDVDCERDAGRLARAARASLHRMHVSNVVPDRLRSCDPEALTCLPPNTPLPRADVPAGECRVFAQATEDGFALTMLARLPAGHVGGEAFVHEWDKAGLRLLRVRYSQ